MPTQGTPGLGVDARGGAVIDPTENVKALSEASNIRQDDLRQAADRLTEEKVAGIRRALESMHNEMQLRDSHAREIRELESKRLDAVRTVDQQTAAIAAERQQNAITLLNNQQAATADNLRAQTASQFAGVNERIAALEKAQYTGAGKGVGLNAGWGYLVAAVVLAATLIGLFLKFQ